MRTLLAIGVLAMMVSASTTAHAAEIRGQYLESRTCDIYTGPCFANAEMALDGKEAVMAWKVEEGGWRGVSLTGLSVAVVVKAESTLGYDGIFAQNPGEIESVILVDEDATDRQSEALVAFVMEAAEEYTGDVQRVVRTSMEMENDYYSMASSFKAGRLAQIETRGMRSTDCVCTNEAVFYQPLVSDVYQATPAYALTHSYRGKDLSGRWTDNNSRSAFLATFRR